MRRRRRCCRRFAVRSATRTSKVTIKKISAWDFNHLVASEYRMGRVFLVGDAAHRHPPANGLGSNTSIQDSYNLAWKVDLVLRGVAGERLLDSYHLEGQPVGRRCSARRRHRSRNEHGSCTPRRSRGHESGRSHRRDPARSPPSSVENRISAPRRRAASRMTGSKTCCAALHISHGLAASYSQRRSTPAPHVCMRAKFGAGKARREHLRTHLSLRHRRRDRLPLDAEIAKDLNRSLVRDVRPRRVGGARVLCHRDGVDTVVRQQRGGRQPGRSRPDDQDVGLDACINSLLSGRSHRGLSAQLTTPVRARWEFHEPRSPAVCARCRPASSSLYRRVLRGRADRCAGPDSGELRRLLHPGVRRHRPPRRHRPWVVDQPADRFDLWIQQLVAVADELRPVTIRVAKVQEMLRGQPVATRPVLDGIAHTHRRREIADPRQGHRGVVHDVRRRGAVEDPGQRRRQDRADRPCGTGTHRARGNRGARSMSRTPRSGTRY
jgi:hypothetical protein